MKYSNKEMKVGQIISSFNDSQINLIPPFQRGSVWDVKMRARLIRNMLMNRPIPAIFLYKEPAGSQFAYNILDGKQRLESLILFVGDKRPDLKVEKVQDYFFRKPALGERNFPVKLDEHAAKPFAKLDDDIVRRFREYAIAIIEIDLDDETTTMDEIVNLFIDINQTGVKVKRFDVAKAIRKDKMFNQVLALIAVKETRGNKKSIYYKSISSDFVFVLKRLAEVSRIEDANSRVDRMWERLTEIALFAKNQKHRAPSDILKGFIKSEPLNQPLSPADLKKLRGVFRFLRYAYGHSADLMQSGLATAQPQFYTLATTLLSTNLVETTSNFTLTKKLTAVSKWIDGKLAPPVDVAGTVLPLLEQFRDLVSKQTTHPKNRAARQAILVQLVKDAA